MHRILVIGETCVDKFVYGNVARICPEAPVPVFVPDLSKTVTTFGMASNVQRNISAIAPTITVDIITNQHHPIKTRFVEHKSNHMIVRIDEGDVISEKFDIKNIDFDKYNAIVVSDYNKGFLTGYDLEKISMNHKLTFLDTKKPLNRFCVGYSFIKINELEFLNSKKFLFSFDAAMHNKLIVTLSERGCRYNDKIYSPKDVSTVMDISGAGDTFLAAFSVNYLITKDVDDSLDYANECAGQVVHKKGVATI